MAFTTTHLLEMTATGLAALAIAVAPSAHAAPASTGPVSGSDSAATQSSQTQSCTAFGPNATSCQSPGNAEVYDAPPQVDYFPYAGGAT
jgi:hypothetical protein